MVEKLVGLRHVGTEEAREVVLGALALRSREGPGEAFEQSLLVFGGGARGSRLA